MVARGPVWLRATTMAVRENQPMPSPSEHLQRVDVLGAPYLGGDIDLGDDAEGAVVPRWSRARRQSTTHRAVLHVHGFADYFFQTGYADWWTGRGYDFYALDLRKYGRSLRPHQTPNYVTDLRDYFAEIDEAWRADHRSATATPRVVLTAHSTGGLILPLWADERRPASWPAWCSTRRGSTCRAAS